MYNNILKKIRAQLEALVGRNFSLTPAVIEIVNNRKVEVYFAYSAKSHEGILRPYLKLVTDYETGVLLEFKNAYYSDFVDSKKYPLGKKLSTKVPVAKTVKEQGELLKNLQTLYEEIRPVVFIRNISSEDRNNLENYAKVLADTIPPELLDFCKAAEPQFFDWIESKTHRLNVPKN